MGAPSILFDISTDPPVEGMKWALDKAADGISDFQTLLEGFGTIFKRDMTKQFGSEGSWGAGGWAPLSPGYDAWKREHYPGRPIGVLSGALRSAMTGGAGYQQKIDKTQASYGIGSSPATKYGGYFAKGTDKQPARPVIKWSREQSREFSKFSQLWLHQELAVVAGKSEVHAVPSVLGGL